MSQGVVYHGYLYLWLTHLADYDLLVSFNYNSRCAMCHRDSLCQWRPVDSDTNTIVGMDRARLSAHWNRVPAVFNFYWNTLLSNRQRQSNCR